MDKFFKYFNDNYKVYRFVELLISNYLIELSFNIRCFNFKIST